jgi:hypothetical protein
MIKSRHFFSLLGLLFLIGAFACKSTQTGVSNTQTGNENANASEAMQSGGVSGGKGSLGRIFRGSVGANKVQMTLNREGDQISGTYFYQKIGTDISVKGSINSQGDFTFLESDSTGKPNGEFKGKWSEAANLPTATLEGTWAKPNSKETLSFYATEQIIEFNNGLRVDTKEIKEENKKLRYSVDVEYPELIGGANPNSGKFNQEVKSLVTKEVKGFKDGVSEAATDEAPANPDSGSDIQIGYDVVLATEDLISVVFGISTYSEGAAHPNSYSQVINYDLKNGKSLKLADLFKPGSEYLGVISRHAVSDLKKQAGQDADNDWIEKGAGPDVDNFLSWNISKRGLALTFDPYQVGSYAEGPKHVVVPYSVLKDISKPDGPIGAMSK